jgi:hypothetical protein
VPLSSLVIQDPYLFITFYPHDAPHPLPIRTNHYNITAVCQWAHRDPMRTIFYAHTSNAGRQYWAAVHASRIPACVCMCFIVSTWCTSWCTCTMSPSPFPTDSTRVASNVPNDNSTVILALAPEELWIAYMSILVFFCCSSCIPIKAYGWCFLEGTKH